MLRLTYTLHAWEHKAMVPFGKERRAGQTDLVTIVIMTGLTVAILLAAFPILREAIVEAFTKLKDIIINLFDSPGG